MGNLKIDNSSLYQESITIIQLAARISNCLLDYVRIANNSTATSMFRTLVSAVLLAKCFNAQLWENSPHITKQFKKIGFTYSAMLTANGKTSIDSLLCTSPREIERVLYLIKILQKKMSIIIFNFLLKISKKSAPFGNDIIDAVEKMPNYSITIQIKPTKLGRIEINQQNQKFEYNEKHKNDGCVLIIGDSNNNVLMYNDNVYVKISI